MDYCLSIDYWFSFILHIYVNHWIYYWYLDYFNYLFSIMIINLYLYLYYYYYYSINTPFYYLIKPTSIFTSSIHLLSSLHPSSSISLSILSPPPSSIHPSLSIFPSLSISSSLLSIIIKPITLTITTIYEHPSNYSIIIITTTNTIDSTTTTTISITTLTPITITITMIDNLPFSTITLPFSIWSSISVCLGYSRMDHKLRSHYSLIYHFSIYSLCSSSIIINIHHILPIYGIHYISILSNLNLLFKNELSYYYYYYYYSYYYYSHSYYYSYYY